MSEISESKEQKILKPEDVQVTDPDLVKAREENVLKTIPGAYTEIEMSTKGKLGAPPIVYVKNFSTEELMELGLSDNEELPIKVCQLLNGIIYQPDPKNKIRIEDFHEKEVIELLLKIFKTYYSPVIKDLDWVWNNDEDKNYLAQRYGGKDSDEYRKVIRSLQTGEWKPKFDVDLRTLKYYELPDDMKTTVLISKENGFTCKYSYERFGDAATLKHFITAKFKERDKQFASISETFRFREEAKQKLLNGDNVNFAGIPNIPQEEYRKLKEYELEKVRFTIIGSKALHLLEYRGTDVSTWPLEKRLELAKDPELDYSTLKQITEKFHKMEIGPITRLWLRNPIQDMKVVERDFSFRVYDILQAVERGESSGVSIEFI
jgi:hypothetical protein